MVWVERCFGVDADGDGRSWYYEAVQYLQLGVSIHAPLQRPYERSINQSIPRDVNYPIGQPSRSPPLFRTSKLGQAYESSVNQLPHRAIHHHTLPQDQRTPSPTVPQVPRVGPRNTTPNLASHVASTTAGLVWWVLGDVDARLSQGGWCLILLPYVQYSTS